MHPRDVVVAAEDSRVIELTTAPLARQSLFQVMAFRDVTEERMNARALREARDLFAGVLQAASEQAIIGTDPLGRITVFNNGAERLLGWTEAEMLGRTPMDFHSYPEVCARAAELGIPVGFEVFVHNVTPETAEIREWTYVRRDGSHVTVSLAVSQMTERGWQLRGIHRRGHRHHRTEGGQAGAGGKRRAVPAGVRHCPDGHVHVRADAETRRTHYALQSGDGRHSSVARRPRCWTLR